MTENRAEQYAKFDEWNNFKKYIFDKENDEIPVAKEGEIWWVAVGKNVGVEIDGKSEYHSRPVLIFKTLSPYGFMGLPLTTKTHGGSWYVRNHSSNQKSYIALSQARIFSGKRLLNKIDKISQEDMRRVRKKFGELYLPK